MTFLVNDGGIVYQNDLGPKTKGVVEKMTEFDQDSTRNRVAEEDTGA